MDFNQNNMNNAFMARQQMQKMQDLQQQMQQLQQQVQNTYPQMQPISQPTQAIDDRNWVTSEIAAEAFLVSKNNTVTLWDSTKNVIYIKRTDAAGRPMPLEKLEYKVINDTQKESEVSSVIEDLQKRIEALEKRGTKNAKTKSDDDDTTA